MGRMHCQSLVNLKIEKLFKNFNLPSSGPFNCRPSCCQSGALQISNQRENVAATNIAGRMKRRVMNWRKEAVLCEHSHLDELVLSGNVTTGKAATFGDVV